MATELTLRDTAGTATPRAAPDREKYLCFTLNQEAFAIAIVRIKEIIEYRPVTVVPMTPDFMRGVINLRGAVVPVIDLMRRFGGERTVLGRRTCIVILELGDEDSGERRVLGVLVDAVTAVHDIASDEIEPPPAFGSHLRPEFLRGMARTGDRFLIVLDAQRTLSTDELVALRQAHVQEAEPAVLQAA